jgi:hypothetical protein
VRNFDPSDLQSTDGFSAKKDFRYWSDKNGRCIEDGLCSINHNANLVVCGAEYYFILLVGNFDKPLSILTYLLARYGTKGKHFAELVRNGTSSNFRDIYSNAKFNFANLTGNEKDYFREHEHSKV